MKILDRQLKTLSTKIILIITFLPKSPPTIRSLKGWCLRFLNFVSLLAFLFGWMLFISQRETSSSSYASAVLQGLVDVFLVYSNPGDWPLASQEQHAFVLCLLPCKGPTYSGCLTNISSTQLIFHLRSLPLPSRPFTSSRLVFLQQNGNCPKTALHLYNLKGSLP